MNGKRRERKEREKKRMAGKMREGK